MKKTGPSSPSDQRKKVRPGREHWWWRKSRLPGVLRENHRLNQLFYWKVKGRKSPDGKKWTAGQRRAIETGLWLYELDARVSHKYLFGQPAHLLGAGQLSSLVSFAPAEAGDGTAVKPRRRRRAIAWEWIEFFDKRGEKKKASLTRAELNGIIAAMKFCLESFVQA